VPANKSENKVYVVKGFGAGSALGHIDPKLNMVTDQGRIMALASGNYTVEVSGGGSEWTKYHPHQLHITRAHATGTWSWPTGDGGVEFGRAGVWPNGVTMVPDSSGVFKEGNETGDGVGYFWRQVD
jgi:hypothetical protein